jgi:hypothetical protein
VCDAGVVRRRARTSTRWCRDIRQTPGAGVDFRIDRVDDLAFAASGKHRLCYSALAARPDVGPGPAVAEEPPGV